MQPIHQQNEQLMIQQAGMMGMEPARHAQVKRLVLPPFAPRELVAFEPEIRAVAKEIVDEFASQGSCEFVFDVASRLPVYTFCKLLGVPNALRETVFTLGNEAADLENYKLEDELSPTMKLFAIAAQLTEQKKQQPDDSMLSRIIHGEVDGEIFLVVFDLNWAYLAATISDGTDLPDFFQKLWITKQHEVYVSLSCLSSSLLVSPGACLSKKSAVRISSTFLGSAKL